MTASADADTGHSLRKEGLHVHMWANLAASFVCKREQFDEEKWEWDRGRECVYVCVWERESGKRKYRECVHMCV